MQRVRDRRDDVAWHEFFDLYGPLIFRYGRQRGLRRQDAEELVASCFDKLSQVIADFEYEPSRGKFRSWLRTLVCHQLADMFARRREQLLPESSLEHGAAPTVPQEQAWEQAWRDQVLEHAVGLARSLSSTQHFQVFQLSVLEGWPAERVAAAFGLSVEQVYRIKHKVLHAIREQMDRYTQES
jgi:RNA polymerase sigma-70 factor (ECF subfamily)